MQSNSDKKIFIIFNTACIGDILINNALCQNIKYFFPGSKIVYVVNPAYKDVALYMKNVDDVVCFDRKKDNTLKGWIKFLREFPYKKPYASFVIYSNDRNLIFSRLLGAKHIVSHAKGLLGLLNTREPYKMKNYEHMKDKSSALIECLTGKSVTNLPIIYEPGEVDSSVVKTIAELAVKNDIIGLSPFSNFILKDMPVEVAAELIEKLSAAGKKVLLLGAGKVARDYSANIKKLGCLDFIDLVDVTDFRELAVILKTIKALISVDTGTMHFANAVKCPVVDIFYSYPSECDVVKLWAPDSKLYDAVTISENQTADNIIENLDLLLSKRRHNAG